MMRYYEAWFSLSGINIVIPANNEKEAMGKAKRQLFEMLREAPDQFIEDFGVCEREKPEDE